MAVNYVNSGERVMYAVPEDTLIRSGGIVVLCDKCWVALGHGAPGDEVSLSRVGRFTLPKDDSYIQQSQKLYYNVYSDKVTARMDGNIVKIGIAAVTAEEDDATAEVILITSI